MNAWDYIDPKDFIFIKSLGSLSDNDLKALTQLYAPLIGADALYIYLTLQYFSKENERPVMLSELLDRTSFDLKRLYTARLYLEGIGLLTILEDLKEERVYIYRIERPLQEQVFLSDSLLVGLLTEKIGANSVKKLIKQTQTQIDKNKYNNITRSFGEVYQLDYSHEAQEMMKIADQKKDSEHQKAIQTDKRVIQKAQQTFDFDFLQSALKSQFVKESTLTDEMKSMIATYHLMYGLNELEVQQILLQAADIQTGYVSAENLLREFLNYIDAQSLTQNKNEKEPEDKYLEKLRQKAQSSGITDSEWQLIAIANQLTPMEFIEDIKRQRGGHVTNSEKWTIKNLVNQSTLSNATINILIHYILEIVKQPAMNQNYAENIANDWAQAGVADPVDAFKRVKQVYIEGQEKHQKRLQSQEKWRNRPKRREQLPAWMKDQVEIDEQISDKKDEKEIDQQTLNELQNLRNQWSKWSKGGEKDE